LDQLAHPDGECPIAVRCPDCGMRWLAECSAVALAEALRMVAPELSAYQVAVRTPDPAAQADPLWWSFSTVVGERFVVKVAWSQPAALRLVHEIGVLAALAREPAVPFLPEVVASSTDPVLLITRLVPGHRCSRSSARSTGIGSASNSPVSWPRCTTRRRASVLRPSLANSPARSCRQPRRKRCANSSARGSGRIRAGSSCAGATGPTRC